MNSEKKQILYFDKDNVLIDFKCGKVFEYYVFKCHSLARKTDFFSKCEWFINGEWIEDSRLTLALNDSMMDYGDSSVFDYDHIKPEIAEELIQTGKTVLPQGSFEPKTIQLFNWEKPK